MVSKRIPVYFLVAIGLIAPLSGCTMCCQPFLDDYGAYGSRTPRVDMKNGRVGSIFSDPNAGAIIETESEPSIVYETTSD